jgi:hypothetical protein
VISSLWAKVTLPCACPRGTHSLRRASSWHSHRGSRARAYMRQFQRRYIDIVVRTPSISSKPSGGFFVLVVRTLGMTVAVEPGAWHAAATRRWRLSRARARDDLMEDAPQGAYNAVRTRTNHHLVPCLFCIRHTTCVDYPSEPDLFAFDVLLFITPHSVFAQVFASRLRFRHADRDNTTTNWLHQERVRIWVLSFLYYDCYMSPSMSMTPSRR